MLSLKELRRAARALESSLSGWKLQRISQPGSHVIVLTFYGYDEDEEDGVKRHILFSVRPDFARVAELEEAPKSLATPPNFVQALRGSLERARFKVAIIRGDDRQLGLKLTTKEGSFELLLSVLGSRSNLYLLDEAGEIKAALRPLDETRRELSIGQPYVNPASGAPDEGEDRWEKLPDEAFLLAIEKEYGSKESEHDFGEILHKLTNTLRKEADFLARKVNNLQRDLDEATRARGLKDQGELLKSVLQNIKPGDTEVEAVDFETGAKITIPLDPKLDPADNLNAYFKRYHKGLTGANMLGQQIEILHGSQKELDELNKELEALVEKADLNDLRTFADRPRVAKLLEKHYPSDKAATRIIRRRPTEKLVPSKLLPRRYSSLDGMEIWVGRSDEGNDYLTTKLAHGNDLFFHLEGWPGSHVILRTGGRKDVPQDSLLDACELAVHYSKQKGMSRANVHVASIKDVKKPAGAKPGLVYVSRGKTVALRHEPKRLERVLEAQIKDDRVQSSGRLAAAPRTTTGNARKSDRRKPVE
ncbi:MAG: DUF814 domain-containing protein [Planctomycetes bacterium]|nr:DUF814 domain-containing protein [Planctomycetota bacterium]